MSLFQNRQPTARSNRSQRLCVVEKSNPGKQLSFVRKHALHLDSHVGKIQKQGMFEASCVHVRAGDGKVHYDADTEPHVNLACISCNRIVDIPSSHVQQLDEEITSTSGYKLLGARVLYYGLCPECQEKSK